MTELPSTSPAGADKNALLIFFLGRCQIKTPQWRWTGTKCMQYLQCFQVHRYFFCILKLNNAVYLLGVLTSIINIMLCYLFHLFFLILKTKYQDSTKICCSMKNWKHYNKLQGNQNFTSGKKSISKHTDLTSNQTEPEFNAT